MFPNIFYSAPFLEMMGKALGARPNNNYYYSSNVEMAGISSGLLYTIAGLSTTEVFRYWKLIGMGW